MHVALPQASKRALFLALAMMAWFLCGSQMIMQDDSWWHLRTGELIWETLSVPLIDPFSWTLPAGTFWANHEWLAQVLFYLTYRSGSFIAVNLAGALVLLATAFYASRAMEGTATLKSIILVGMLPWLVRAFSVRPHIFTLLAISLFFFIVIRKPSWMLPVLFFVWAQVHAGVVLGIIFIYLFAACAFILDKTRTKKLLFWAVLCTVAASINPLGPYLFLYPFAPFKQITGLPIIEWMPPGASKPLDLYFWFCAGMLLVTSAINWRRCMSYPAAPIVLCGIITLIPATQHVRHIYVWFVIAGIAVTYTVSKRSVGESRVNRSRIFGCTILVCSFLSIAFATVSLFHPNPRLGWQPVTAAGLRALEQAPMPTFNSYGTGGFILWFTPKRKVFMDSRQDPYPNPFLSEAMNVQTSGNYTDMFKRFGIKSAIVERPMPLVDALINAGWSVSYDGYYFTVLIDKQLQSSERDPSPNRDTSDDASPRLRRPEP